MTGFFRMEICRLFKSIGCFYTLYVRQKCFPIICKPTGKPSEKPALEWTCPGSPAKLTGMVKNIIHIHCDWIIDVFPPRPKATVGVDGPMIKS